MAESHVLTRLLALRYKIIGKIEYPHKPIAKLNNDVVHLEATIKLVTLF